MVTNEEAIQRRMNDLYERKLDPEYALNSCFADIWKHVGPHTNTDKLLRDVEQARGKIRTIGCQAFQEGTLAQLMTEYGIDRV